MAAAAKVPQTGWPEPQKRILAVLKSGSPKPGVEKLGSFLGLFRASSPGSSPGSGRARLPRLVDSHHPCVSSHCPPCSHCPSLCPRFSLHKDTSPIGLGNDLNLNWFSTKTLLDMRLPSWCSLTVYKGDFGIFTDLTVVLEHFCSLTFYVLGVLNGILSSVNTLENNAFPVHFLLKPSILPKPCTRFSSCLLAWTKNENPLFPSECLLWCRL